VVEEFSPSRSPRPACRLRPRRGRHRAGSPGRGRAGRRPGGRRRRNPLAPCQGASARAEGQDDRVHPGQRGAVGQRHRLLAVAVRRARPRRAACTLIVLFRSGTEQRRTPRRGSGVERARRVVRRAEAEGFVPRAVGEPPERWRRWRWRWRWRLLRPARGTRRSRRPGRPRRNPLPPATSPNPLPPPKRPSPPDLTHSYGSARSPTAPRRRRFVGEQADLRGDGVHQQVLDCPVRHTAPGPGGYGSTNVDDRCAARPPALAQIRSQHEGAAGPGADQATCRGPLIRRPAGPPTRHPGRQPSSWRTGRWPRPAGGQLVAGEPASSVRPVPPHGTRRGRAQQPANSRTQTAGFGRLVVGVT